MISSQNVPNTRAIEVKRSTGMPGILGDLWREFINLPTAAQLEALSGPRFRGTTWQALLQCTPYFEFPDNGQL